MRPSDRGGSHERELVAQLPRVLDDADDSPRSPVERERRSEVQPDHSTDTDGDSYLAGAAPIAPATEREKTVDVRPVRIEGVVVDPVDAARNMRVALDDDVRRAEPPLGRREVCG